MTISRDLRWVRSPVLVILSLACSSLLALSFKPVLHDKAQLLPFTLAVIITSAYGGLTAGLITTVLGFAIADFFFMEPVHELLTVPDDYPLLFVFLIFGTSLSVVNHALAKAKSAAEERSRELTRSNEELQRFAYAVSHDLQEPLRSIQTFTQLFLRRNRGLLDEESSHWLDFVVSGAQRMRRMIESVLEFSVAGREAEIGEIDSGAALKSALQDLNNAIEQSKAELRVGAPLPGVLADEKQLTRVFLNLIGNAIRYHQPDSPPVVAVSAEPDRGDWIFSVKDDGPGIDPSHRERVFESFQRLDSRKPGHGLGLATCKRIVERLGGRIWVESQLGRGANFRFTLPAATRDWQARLDSNQRPSA